MKKNQDERKKIETHDIKEERTSLDENAELSGEAMEVIKDGSANGTQESGLKSTTPKPREFHVALDEDGSVVVTPEGECDPTVVEEVIRRIRDDGVVLRCKLGRKK